MKHLSFSQKQIHIIIFVILFISCLLLGILKVNNQNIVIYDVALTVLTSSLASCIFSWGYGMLIKNKEIEEITDRAVKRINNAYPDKIYPACEQAGTSFSHDLKEELGRCNRFYWYEGNSLKVASSCIQSLFRNKNKTSFASINLFVPKLYFLSVPEARSLIESIIVILDLITKYRKHDVNLFVIHHPTLFHVHLTENMVMFSPFKGIISYPTTFKYIYAGDSDNNSYYYNIRSRLETLIKEAEQKEVNEFGKRPCTKIRINHHKYERDNKLLKSSKLF